MEALGEDQTGLNRIGYDIFRDAEPINSYAEKIGLLNILFELTGHSLLYTQAVGFELSKNKHHGFPWHIDNQSYGHIRSKDFACSIWIPLDPIENQHQKGGMSYVSTSVLSGSFIYDQVDTAINTAVEAILAQNPQGLTLADYMALKHGIFNSPAYATLLNLYRRSDDFDLGDALIFNKYVIHRSEMLQDGPLDSRTAFVMRYVDYDSHYDRSRALSIEHPKIYFGQPSYSDFHLRVGHHNGELIRESPIFAKGHWQ